jgi:heme/copper-type cytochrome/quinol oxidase subunit 2
MKQAIKDAEIAMKDQENGVHVSTIVAIVIVLILANVIIVYLCRRKAKRDMNNEMNMQIESAVSQYFALSQEKK